MYLIRDRWIQPGKLFRSAAWARSDEISSEGLAAALNHLQDDLCIRTLIDLRTNEERR